MNWLQMMIAAKDHTKFNNMIDGDPLLVHRRYITEVGDSWYVSIFEFVRLIQNTQLAKEQQLDCDWFVEMRPHTTVIGKQKDDTKNVVYSIMRVERWCV